MGLDSPHDALFKEIFSRPEFAAVELRAVLPPALVQHIDWSTLTALPGSFVELGDRDRHADLLYQVELRGRPAFVYVLFEHQSGPSDFMPLRLLGYAVRLWERVRREDESAEFLPPVIPVVLHHSEAGWKSATSFQELFDSALVAELGLSDFLPSFRFLLDDLSHASDEELQQRAQREAEHIVPVVLWALRDARATDRLLASFAAWTTALSTALRAPSGKEALLAVFGYIALVAEILSPDAILDAIEEAAPEAKDTIMTLAEIWLQQGIEKGLEKGRAEGIEKGIEKGERAVLAKQLTLKFGALDEAVRTRLEAASLAELDLWSERILTVTTLGELFGE